MSFETETRLVNPILYRIRQALNRAPNLDPRIRTYAIDDVTIGYMKRPNLLLNQWVDVLEALDTRSPKAIVVDALFSIMDSSLDSDEQTKQRLVERLIALKTPIVMGSFASPQKIEGRDPWELTDPALAIGQYVKILPQSPLTPEQEAAALPIANFLGSTVYGPAVFLRPGLKRVGHILYGAREGRFDPFLRIAPDRVLPHVMLRAVGGVYFQQGVLMVQGSELPVAQDGSAYINFSSRSTLAKSVRPIRQLLREKSLKKELSTINSEDYVYIIQMYYTGNTDFKPSPVGIMSGAFSHLSILNNILQKNFLRPIEAGPWFVAGFGGLAAILAWWLSPAALIAVMFGFLSVWAATCIYAFAWLGWVLPWFGPNLCFLFVCISVTGFRLREGELKASYIRHSLQGTVEPHVLKELSKHPERLSLEARERVLTIMFIDIVGFSLTIENQLPRTAFEGLRGLIDDISVVIHQHGGVVNKTLGDGLLCFFGYSFEADKESSDHAEQSLKAALEVQKSNVPRMIRSAKLSEPIFPLRIGINTSAVFLGNLGSGEKLDFTVIGNGVNFAKRLEGACLPHSVLVSPTTKELVEPLGNMVLAKRRLIAIKHHVEMVESWEYDPFIADPGLRAQAEEVYKISSYLTRVERRWSVAKPERIILTTLTGPAHLINFSSTGLSFSVPGLITRGTRMILRIDSIDGALHQQLAGYGLQEIQVEVRWVQKSEERYLHGVRYLELDARQTDIVTDLLCQYALAEFEEFESDDAAS